MGVPCRGRLAWNPRTEEGRPDVTGRGAPLIHMGMSEADLDYHIRAWSKDLGLAAFHHPESRGARRGWPDWVIYGPYGLIFREGKGVRGRASPYQLQVIADLRALGYDAGFWWPLDAVEGRVLDELRAISRLRARVAP